MGIEFADDSTSFMYGSPDAAQSCHIASRSEMKKRAAAASRRTSVSAENWYEALVTLNVAESAGSDILVTERADTLLSRDPSVGRTDFIVTRPAAVSFFGLYFREHEEWGELPPPSVLTSRKEWLARRTAVHAVLDWAALGHLTGVSPATGDPALHTRADSLIKRVITATSIRDRICADAMKPPSHGRHESIAAHLEWLALTLSGAFDSLALTVNDHLGGCKRDKRSVSWTNKDWRDAAEEHYDDLVSVVEGKAVITYLSLCKYLRDTIHDIGPSEFIGSHHPSDDGKLYVSMPDGIAAQCKRFALGLTGRASSLGLVEDFGGPSFDPVVLADRLVDIGLAKLNLLLRAMPWEAFGSDASALPTPGTHPMYSEQSEQFAKACFGLTG